MIKLSKYIKMIKICQIKVAVHLKTSILVLTKTKEKQLEYHQTFERPRKHIPVWCTSTNFDLHVLVLKRHQIFQNFHFHKFHSSFEKNYSPQIYS